MKRLELPLVGPPGGRALPFGGLQVWWAECPPYMTV
jgi:hypothetical protein